MIALLAQTATATPSEVPWSTIVTALGGVLGSAALFVKAVSVWVGGQMDKKDAIIASKDVALSAKDLEIARLHTFYAEALAKANTSADERIDALQAKFYESGRAHHAELLSIVRDGRGDSGSMGKPKPRGDDE